VKSDRQIARVNRPRPKQKLVWMTEKAIKKFRLSTKKIHLKAVSLSTVTKKVQNDNFCAKFQFRFWLRRSHFRSWAPVSVSGICSRNRSVGRWHRRRRRRRWFRWPWWRGCRWCRTGVRCYRTFSLSVADELANQPEANPKHKHVTASWPKWLMFDFGLWYCCMVFSA